MNILSILASPKKHGNTATLLDAYLDGVHSLDPLPQIENVYLQSKKIEPCKGCNACHKDDHSPCIIDDDMQKLYKDIEKADILIFSTPVYFFNVTAQLKTFLDRFYAMDYSKFANKKIVLLTTYGDVSKDHSGVENVVNTFERIANYLKMDFIQNLNVSTHDQKIVDNGSAKQSAHTLGTEILK